MTKELVTGISAVAIIFPESDPTRLACDLKDAGYPAFPWKLIFTGGNWVGGEAGKDHCPHTTVRRELCEEFTLTPTLQSRIEAKLLGDPTAQDYTLPQPKIDPTPAELEEFRWLTMGVAALTAPWLDFWQVVSAERLSELAGKPRNAESRICSVYAAPLPNTLWNRLVHFWDRFGNISQESLYYVTSAAEIIGRQIGFGWGQDQMYRDFLLSHGCPEARQIPVVEGIAVSEIGEPFESYQDYLDHYEITKSPFTPNPPK